MAHTVCLVAVGSLCLFLVFTGVWARISVDTLVRGRVADITPRIALKTAVGDEQGAKIAARMQRETPGLRVTVVTRAEAEALLALQEPWMKTLPQIEIGKLPVMLTIQHPALLDSPETIMTFLEKAAQMPETDFVIFNTNGYDQFVRAAQNARAYARLFARLLVIVALASFIVIHTALSGRRGRRGIPVAFCRGVAIGSLSSVTAIVLHKSVQALAARVYYPLAPVPAAYAAFIAGIAIIVCVILEIVNALRSAGYQK